MKRKKIAIVFAAMSLMLMTGCGAQKEKLKQILRWKKNFLKYRFMTHRL